LTACVLRAAVVGLGWWGQKIVRDLAGSAQVTVMRGIDPRDEGRAFAAQAGLGEMLTNVHTFEAITRSAASGLVEPVAGPTEV
jgi:hypothetical protein